VEFHFASIFVFLVVGVGLAAFTLGLSKLIRPFKPGAEKSSIYECGERPIGSPWIRFNIRFYVALIEALAYVWKKGDLEWVRPKVHRKDVDIRLPGGGAPDKAQAAMGDRR
jgi:NADH:ubiquinone oxidoreductase subunit 3 (subunit A)